MSRHALREWIDAAPDEHGVYCVTTLPPPRPSAPDAEQHLAELRARYRAGQKITYAQLRAEWGCGQ